MSDELVTSVLFPEVLLGIFFVFAQLGVPCDLSHQRVHLGVSQRLCHPVFFVLKGVRPVDYDRRAEAAGGCNHICQQRFRSLCWWPGPVRGRISEEIEHWSDLQAAYDAIRSGFE